MEKIEVRKLRPDDDFVAVGRLIYFTDDYVFPYMFRCDADAAARAFALMVQKNTVYAAENITVAVADGKIVGIVVAKHTPVPVDPAPMIDSILQSGSVVDESFSRVYNEYYKLLADEPQGVYVANVCVDRAFRGMGVAKRMLQEVLRDDCDYNLETVKANSAAFALYAGLGFKVVCEYPGFTDVPCYRMTRAKAKSKQ